MDTILKRIIEDVSKGRIDAEEAVERVKEVIAAFPEKETVYVPYVQPWPQAIWRIPFPGEAPFWRDLGTIDYAPDPEWTVTCHAAG